jgi:hypothetical protein
MPASSPASILNQSSPDLGIPDRFSHIESHSRTCKLGLKSLQADKSRPPPKEIIAVAPVAKRRAYRVELTAQRDFMGET